MTLYEIEQQYGLSVVVPAWNEVDNVVELVERIHTALTGFKHEIIIIDDNSTDGTFEVLQTLTGAYPLIVQRKVGKHGKAFSIIEGVHLAHYDTVAMIDADLQYPPEALPEMLNLIHQGKADIVVANRKENHTSKWRKFLTLGFRNFFGQLLWKLDVDVQSGQKVFRREIFERLNPNPKYPWAFDMEFLIGARNGGYHLASYDIIYAERKAGEVKNKWLPVAKELGMSALHLRLNPKHLIPFHRKWSATHGLGFHFKGKGYVTHTSLERAEMALERTVLSQRILIIAVLAALAACFAIDVLITLIVLVSLITIVYFLDLLFNLYLILRSFYVDSELKVRQSEIAQRELWFDWPKYTIFCPLYRESEVLPQFVRAMSRMDYPKDKLEVMLLLEEDDQETIRDVREMMLPDYFRIIIVPHSMPKTKPKACNFGLLHANGKYSVIYDAEDIPEPTQLKKAVVAFEAAGPNVGCIQAKLNYYNWNQNLLTRLFTLEYSLWFNLILPGLQSLHAPIPLGGTSNHFRLSDLRALGGWDPFNVTEDADLGMRIAKQGLQTTILDSYTMEEANSHFGNWLKQRSRWIKGYMQTFLVHMRQPRAFLKHKKRHLPFFQLIIGGKVLSMLINPLLWMMTIAYFTLPQQTAEFIQSLFLGPIFYMGIFALIFGNFLYTYFYMAGGAKQQKSELVAYSLFIPIYWLMMSFAAVLALRDLLVRPFHWHKTKHGLHLNARNSFDAEDLLPEAAS
jgi:cellulose synthase/poly-beta-1,6-N-acetylglucosamine synthase-like glycosyltransferase